MALFAPIPHKKLQTFDPATHKRRKTKQPAKSEVVTQDHSLYAKLLIASKSGEVDMKVLLMYTLNPVPLCFTLTDGTRCKAKKDALMPILMAGTLQVDLSCLGNGNALISKVEAARLLTKFGESGQHVIN